MTSFYPIHRVTDSASGMRSFIKNALTASFHACIVSMSVATQSKSSSGVAVGAHSIRRVGKALMWACLLKAGSSYFNYSCLGESDW